MSVQANFLYPIDFIPFGDNRLNQISERLTPEEVTSEKIQRLIHEMLAICGYESDPNQTGKKSFLVGLAAPQVGALKQIVIIDPRTVDEMKANLGKAEFEVLINPVVTWKSEEEDLSREGCFSVPEKYAGAVKRPISVEVEALDRDGNFFKKRYHGQAAFVVQHEIDHLNGTRFPQRLDSENDLHILDGNDMIQEYRKHWRTWKKHASFDEWQQMKNGIY